MHPTIALEEIVVAIKGAGDLASGVAIRLHRAGLRVIMTEQPHPLVVRRTVAFAQAVFSGHTQVEEARGELIHAPGAAADCWARGIIPVLVDPNTALLRTLVPHVLVDGIMAKHNTGTTLHDAPLVIALGPGFTAGRDCHAVIETNRGHNLGRVIRQGAAEADTGQPGALPGVGRRASRVLRAPADGRLHPHYAIGDRIPDGACIAHVETPDGEQIPLAAPFAGVLRGLIHPSVPLSAGLKIGDLDPRTEPAYCFTISDKSMAIAGGVLEAILVARRQGLQPTEMDSQHEPS